MLDERDSLYQDRQEGVVEHGRDEGAADTDIPLGAVVVEAPIKD